MQIIWTPEALQDRIVIWEYIVADNPLAAVKMDALFSHAANQLSLYPEMGRIGDVAGTRELIPHESYRLIYEVKQSEVWILALIHTAQQWPPVY